MYSKALYLHLSISGFMGAMDAPINRSKGCGGSMRVAPVALFCIPERMQPQDIDMPEAKIAAFSAAPPRLSFQADTVPIWLYALLSFFFKQPGHHQSCQDM